MTVTFASALQIGYNCSMTINELITRTGLTDAELAAKLHTNPSTVWRWRNELTGPTQAIRGPLCRLANAKLKEVEWKPKI